MTQGKSRLSQKFVNVTNVFIIAVFVLGVVYFIWMRFRIPLVFYINNYRYIGYIGALVFYISYVFIIPMMYFSQISIQSFKISKIGILRAVMFLTTTLLCCISSAALPSLPRVLDKTELSNTTYYLTGELEVLDVHAFHRLYKCNNSSFLCEQTPFYAGEGSSFLPLHLMIDKTTNPDEINVTRTSYDGESTFLEYTYGTHPRYYDYPVQLNDHLYYLAHYRYTVYRPESTTFVFYECKLDNTSCKKLPVQYEGFGIFRDTTINETTGEISVFIDDEVGQDTLIFTWGENPQCYVQDCEILEENE